MNHSKDIIDLIKSIGFELTEEKGYKSEIYRYKKYKFEISYDGICHNHIRYLLTETPLVYGESIIDFYEPDNCVSDEQELYDNSIKEGISFLLDFFKQGN